MTLFISYIITYICERCPNLCICSFHVVPQSCKHSDPLSRYCSHMQHKFSVQVLPPGPKSLQSSKISNFAASFCNYTDLNLSLILSHTNREWNVVAGCFTQTFMIQLNYFIRSFHYGNVAQSCGWMVSTLPKQSDHLCGAIENKWGVKRWRQQNRHPKKHAAKCQFSDNYKKETILSFGILPQVSCWQYLFLLSESVTELIPQF